MIFKNGYAKMHIEIKQVWWVWPLMKVRVVIFYKAQQWHACICSTPEASYRLFGFELLNLEFRTHMYLMDRLLKGAYIMHNRWSERCDGCNSWRYGSSYVTGPAKTGHICTKYTCSESISFLGLFCEFSLLSYWFVNKA